MGDIFFDGLRANKKGFYQYEWKMCNLPVPKVMTHKCECTLQHKKYDISLAREFQKNLSDTSCKNGVIYQGKYRKQSSKNKWTENDYHVK